jgi:hypothetical protein
VRCDHKACSMCSGAWCCGIAPSAKQHLHAIGGVTSHHADSAMPMFPACADEPCPVLHCIRRWPNCTSRCAPTCCAASSRMLRRCVLCCAVLCCAVLRCAVLCCAVLCCAADLPACLPAAVSPSHLLPSCDCVVLARSPVDLLPISPLLSPLPRSPCPPRTSASYGWA